jgi:hypothetical protein
MRVRSRSDTGCLVALAEIVIHEESDLWVKLSTVATFMAVAAALFGPLVLDWLRRPKIRVTRASDLVTSMDGNPESIGKQRLVLNVINQGKRQASDIQVFLTLERPVEIPGMDDVYSITSFQTPLAFAHREGGEWALQYSVAVPHGFSRPLQLFAETEDGFALANGPESAKAALQEGDYRAVLDIVGSNFKVARYEGQLRIGDDDGESGVRWKRAPRRVAYKPGDPLA